MAALVRIFPVVSNEAKMIILLKNILYRDSIMFNTRLGLLGAAELASIMRWLSYEELDWICQARPYLNRIRHSAYFQQLWTISNITIVETTHQGKLISQTPHDKFGRKHGIYVNFYENKNIYDEISYIRDQKDGPARRYDSYGNMIHESIYWQDKMHGLSRQWFAQNVLRTVEYMRTQLLYEYTYENGQREGVSRVWATPGVISSVATYNGSLNGICRTYYDTGLIRTERTYKKGELHGSWKKWDIDNRLYKERHYVDGKCTHTKRLY